MSTSAATARPIQSRSSPSRSSPSRSSPSRPSQLTSAVTPRPSSTSDPTPSTSASPVTSTPLPAAVITKKKTFLLGRDGISLPKHTGKDLVTTCKDDDNIDVPKSMTVESMPEYQEKKRLLDSLIQCDKRIQSFETHLLNLHDGKVILFILFSLKNVKSKFNYFIFNI